MSDENYDVVIIGAGAAGLLAAATAAEKGRRTLLVEKNRKAGVKILMSGGTRCNLTQATDSQGIVKAFGSQGRFLHSALATLDPESLVAWFEAEGVPTKVESTGKIFPYSDRAADVLEALLSRVRRSGALLALGEPVQAINAAPSEKGGRFLVSTSRREIASAAVLITSGGQSYPGCGTTGDGYVWAKQFGHSIRPPRPALVPLRSPSPWIQQLSGVTIPDVRVRLYAESDPKRSKQWAKEARRDSFLFTHQGLSGPAVLDVSRYFTEVGGVNDIQLLCDFLPSLTETQLLEGWRSAAAKAGRRKLVGELAESLPKRLVEELMGLAELPLDRTLAELSRSESSRLAAILKSAPAPISGSLGFKKAEVTAGGVTLKEVDSKTMQSKRHPGLYFAGEVLDLDGPIGGYNFQAAFSTGTLAGLNV